MPVQDHRSRGVLLRRAWRHVISHALFSHPGRALKILGLGLLTMLAQFAAVLAVVGAARAWDNQGILNVLEYQLDLTNSANSNGWLYAAAGFSVFTIAIILGIYNRVYVTRIGRTFFEDKLLSTRRLIAERIQSGKPFNRGTCLAFLSRDSRFLAVSYTRILMLVQPALLLIALLGLTFFLQPNAALIMVVIGVIVLPAHAWLLLWAQRSSDDIADSAKIKAGEEKQYIDALSQSPVPVPPESLETFKGGAGQDGFLSAFVKRQRLSAFSQAITDIMSLAILIVFGLVLVLGGNGEMNINAASLVLLFILWRFLSSYISSLAQAITMVSSYEPFFRGLLDFESGEHGKSSASSDLSVAGEVRSPLRLAIFQKTSPSRETLSPFSRAFGQPIEFISHKFDISRENLTDIRKTLDGLDSLALADLDGYLAGGSDTLEARTQLLLSVEITEKDKQPTFLLDGSAFSNLEAADLRALLAGIKNCGLILVYRGLPNRLAIPPRFQLAANNGEIISILGDAHEFQSRKEDLRAAMESSEINQTDSDASLDIEGLAEGI